MQAGEGGPEDGDEELEDEALGAGAVFLARDDFAENIGEDVGGLAGDFDAVVAEDGLLRGGEEKVQRRAALREIAQEEALDGGEELGVEVVDPELVEVAEDDEWWAARDDVDPVFEDLVAVHFPASRPPPVRRRGRARGRSDRGRAAPRFSHRP